MKILRFIEIAQDTQVLVCNRAIHSNIHTSVCVQLLVVEHELKYMAYVNIMTAIKFSKLILRTFYIRGVTINFQQFLNQAIICKLGQLSNLIIAEKFHYKQFLEGTKNLMQMSQQYNWCSEIIEAYSTCQILVNFVPLRVIYILKTDNTWDYGESS